MAKFTTNENCATWWSKLEPMLIYSWSDNSKGNTLGPLCLWQCLNVFSWNLLSSFSFHAHNCNRWRRNSWQRGRSEMHGGKVDWMRRTGKEAGTGLMSSSECPLNHLIARSNIICWRHIHCFTLFFQTSAPNWRCCWCWIALAVMNSYTFCRIVLCVEIKSTDRPNE